MKRASVLVGVAALVAVGCSSGSDSAGESITEESLVAQLEEVGGEVVADTSISYEPENRLIRAGGLEVSIPELVDERERPADKAFPPNWRTLNRFRVAGDGPLVTVSVAVFPQQTTVSDDDTRQQFVQDFLRLKDPQGNEGREEVLNVRVEGSEPERSCWAYVEANPEDRLSHLGLVTVVGPGLAATGWSFTFSNLPEEIEAASALLESICGAPVDGLEVL